MFWFVVVVAAIVTAAVALFLYARSDAKRALRVPPDRVEDPPPPPRVGDEIYVPSALYLSHGRDDFAGGLCRVVQVIPERIGDQDTHTVEVAERPGSFYNWTYLAKRQSELRQAYGDRRGHADPDMRWEFNRP